MMTRGIIAEALILTTVILTISTIIEVLIVTTVIRIVTTADILILNRVIGITIITATDIKIDNFMLWSQPF